MAKKTTKKSTVRTSKPAPKKAAPKKTGPKKFASPKARATSKGKSSAAKPARRVPAALAKKPTPPAASAASAAPLVEAVPPPAPLAPSAAPALANVAPTLPAPPAPLPEPPRAVAGPHDKARTRELAIAMARLLSDDKCEDVVVMDVGKIRQDCDFVIVGSGTSDRQMRSVLRHVEELGQQMGSKAFRVSTDERATWLLADFVHVVVHLFEPNTRAHYDLEMLFEDAPRIGWERPDQVRKDRAGLHRASTHDARDDMHEARDAALSTDAFEDDPR